MGRGENVGENVGQNTGYMGWAVLANAPIGHGLPVDRYCSPSGTATWLEAADESTPCSYQTAMQSISAGYTVEWSPETFVLTGTNNQTEPCIRPSAGGTAGNEITFVAKYPAAYNEDSIYRTQLKRVGAAQYFLSPLYGPGFGNTWYDYVVFDGFYVNYAEDGQPTPRGVFYINDSSNNTIRRCRVDRENLGSVDDDDNYNCIHLNFTNSITLENNIFSGGYDPTGSHNEAAILTYASTNMALLHNLFDGVTAGIYIKGDFNGTGNDGIAKFNRFLDCKKPINTFYGPISGGSDMEFAQNLIDFTQALSLVNQDFSFDLQPSTVANTLNFNIHHNTILVHPDTSDGGFVVRGDFAGLAFAGSRFVDNLVACVEPGLAAPLINAYLATSFAQWNQFNYNWYHNNGSNLRFNFNSNIYSDASAFTTWKGVTGVDANSSFGDPEFTDAANHDFTLAAGSGARSASSTGGVLGCYILGSEEIGLEASPSY